MEYITYCYTVNPFNKLTISNKQTLMSLILLKMYEISCGTSIPRKKTAHAVYLMAAIESRERYYKEKGAWIVNMERDWLFHLLTLEFLQKLLSGPMIILTIPLKLRVVLQNIWRRVVVNVLIKISPSNIFLTFLLPTWFYQYCRATFGRCEA